MQYNKTRLGLVALLILLAFPIVFAAEYELNITYPNPDDVYSFSVFSNTPLEQVVTVKNIGNRSFFNVSGEAFPQGSFGSIDVLNPGESKSLPIKLLSGETGKKNFAPKLFFLYPALFTEDPNTVIIDVNNDGFSNVNATVFDTITIVRWRNSGDENHTVTSTETDVVFDQVLAPGEIFEKTFSRFGRVNYYDKTTGRTADLQVTNKTYEVMTRSVSFDKEINLLINTSLRQAEISSDIFITNFSISYNDVFQTAFQIENTKNYTIPNVKFDLITKQDIASTGSFSENNFNLGALEKKVVVVSGRLSITETVDTDEYYDVFLRITADNIDPVEKRLSVYVKPFSFSVNQSEGCIDFEALRRFCNENPNAAVCGNQPLIQNQTVIVYQDIPNSVNITQTQFENLMSLQLELDSIPDRVENKAATFIDLLQNQNDIIENLSRENNRLYSQIQETNDKIEVDRKTARFWFWFKIIFWSLAFVAGLIGWLLYRRFGRHIFKRA